MKSERPDIRITSFDEAEAAFRELLEQSELPSPDEVVRERDPDELVFIWHQAKVACVVELGTGEGQRDEAMGEAEAAEAETARDRAEPEPAGVVDPDLELGADIEWEQGFEREWPIEDEVTLSAVLHDFPVPREKLM